MYPEVQTLHQQIYHFKESWAIVLFLSVPPHPVSKKFMGNYQCSDLSKRFHLHNAHFVPPSFPPQCSHSKLKIDFKIEDFRKLVTYFVCKIFVIVWQFRKHVYLNDMAWDRKTEVWLRGKGKISGPGNIIRHTATVKTQRKAYGEMWHDILYNQII